MVDIPFLKRMWPTKRQSKAPVTPLSDDGIEQWEQFAGQGNSPRLLEQKATVIAELIRMSADLPFDLAESFQEETPSIKLNVEQKHRSRLEAVAFALRIVDELSSLCLSGDQRNILMTAIESILAETFCNDIFLPDQFDAFIQEKYEDYGSYKRWSDTDPGTGITLFWEYERRQAHIIGIGKSALYNTMLGALLAEQINRWGIRNLLSP